MSDELIQIEASKLREICRGILKDELKEEEGKSETKQESKDVEVKNEANGWTPAEQPAYAFNLGASEKWPASTGVSRREKDLVRRKEQAHG